MGQKILENFFRLGYNNIKRKYTKEKWENENGRAEKNR